MNKEPIAFLSYSHFDDQHDGQYITRLRQLLVGEMRVQTGIDFEIFQDRENIDWGQKWQQRIDESLDAVTFLIPILTPNFFAGPACRQEVERFLERERKLGRTDLILPLYYIDHPPFNNDTTRMDNLLAQEIHAHQYVDWRPFRNKSLKNGKVRGRLEHLALSLRSALGRTLSNTRSSGTDIVARRVEPAVEGLLSPSIDPIDRVMELELVPTHRMIDLGKAQTLIGEDAIARTAIQLLQQIPVHDMLRHEKRIRLTSQSAHDIGEHTAAYPAWRSALRGVLEQGWDVDHLWRFDHDANLSIPLIKNIKDFVGASGTYEVRYFTPYGALAPTYDFLIVPNIGVLVMLSTSDANVADSAIYLPESEHTVLLSSHFKLLADQTHSLFHSHSPNLDGTRTGALFRDFTEIYCKPGDLFRVKDGLSETVRPAAFYEPGAHYLEAINVSDQPHTHAVQSSRDRWKKRWQSFNKQIQDYYYRDVCPWSAIERLAEQGKLSSDEQSARPGYVATREDKIALLDNATNLLSRFTNYEIALLDEGQEQEFLQAQWLVKGDEDVFIEIWGPEEKEADLVITEPTITRAFHRHAADLWGKIPEKNRDKEEVIKRLKKASDELK